MGERRVQDPFAEMYTWDQFSKTFYACCFYNIKSVGTKEVL